jgi:prolyl 4-hydroxylase
VLIKTFNNPWQQWFDHHAESKSDKELLFVVLLNNFFDWEFIQEKLDYTPKNEKTLNRKELQKRLLTEDWSGLLPIYPILADNPYVQRYDTGLAEIYELDKAITDDECDVFKELVLKYATKSLVTDPYASKSIRTSRTATLVSDFHPIIDALNLRLYQLFRAPEKLSEDLQGSFYDVGQEFKPHFDFFDFNLEYNKPYIKDGQRLWTVIVYLDEPKSGGCTTFPKLDISIKPKKGNALIWRNCYPNKAPNPFTLHASTPIIEGEKTILTKWLKEQVDIK